ncbi:MAG TPA: SLC13 family permease [Thermoplasmata archaeon]|nr:SLC13 family permease [Thermoplasmata archaeon]
MAVFAAVIARQVTGRVAPVWLIFVGGGLAVAALGVLSESGLASALIAAGPTLLFLFALFLFAGALQSSGSVEHLAHWLIGRARRPRDLPLVLFCGIGLVSAVVVNDPLVLIGVPILVAVAGRIRTDPKPLLLVLAFSVSVGSTLTPFGNPQNLLVATQSGISDPVTTFLRYLALPTAVNLLLVGWYLRRVYGPSMPKADVEYDRLHAESPALFPRGGWSRRLRRHPVLWVFPGTMVVLVTVDLSAALTSGPAVPFWETALAGAAVLLCVTPARATTLRQVNWSILLLFAGLFIVVAGAVQGGVISALAGFLPIPGPGHPSGALLATVGASAIGSQFVSNVPWVALQIPVLTSLGYGGGTPVVWMALAAGATLAGNVSLLGAVSNLIVVDTAEKHGVHIRLGEFVRHGLPIAAITLLVLVALLSVGL